MKIGMIVTAGLIVSLGVVVLLLTESDDVVKQKDLIETKEPQTVLSDSSTVNIVHESTKKMNASPAAAPWQKSKQAPKKVVKRDPNVKYQTVDTSERYGLQVIDESGTPIESTQTVSFEGTINGNRFTIKIPVEIKNDDLKLRIVDRKTKEAKVVSLSFASELGTYGYAPKMEVKFSDAENYNVESNPQVARVFP
jgi:hypothetical protein